MDTSDLELVNCLEAAIAHLLWMSESDFPFEVVFWANQPLETLTVPQLLALTGHAPDTPVTQMGCERFFRWVTQPQDWHSPEEQATVRRYQALVATLQTELSDLRVYQIGTLTLDIFILGQTPANHVAGITTKAIGT